MEKKITTHITSGLLISGVLIILAVVAYIASFDQQTWYKWLSGILFIGAVIYVCINYGKQQDNNVTFGNTFAYGFKTSAVVTCIMILFLIVFMQVFPEIKEKAMDEARKQMEKNPAVTESQIETSLGIMKKGFLVILILGSVFFYLGGGAIAAVIGAAVTKKNPRSPFDNQA